MKTRNSLTARKADFPSKVRQNDVITTRNIPQTMCFCLTFPAMFSILMYLQWFRSTVVWE